MILCPRAPRLGPILIAIEGLVCRTIGCGGFGYIWQRGGNWICQMYVTLTWHWTQPDEKRDT